MNTQLSGLTRPRTARARPTPTPTWTALAVAALLASTPTWAADRANGTLPAVTVTGNPLKTTDLIAPSSSYSGATLLLRSQSTLGETLDGTPGVSSSYFGPNASRPVIRGLDGDRVRILQNSGASVDASGLSNDHAVPADPISMERIEVLRGPGALMYGGSAVGGVVNVLDNRIAQQATFDAQGGVAAKINLEAATGNTQRSVAALLETGTDRYALHVDGFNRRSGDVAAPIALACSKSGVPVLRDAMCNSAAQTSGAAVGATVFSDHARLGASLSSYQSDYGTVAEDAVTIGMRSNRAALEWDLNQLPGWIHRLELRASQTDYQHTEFDDGQAGTVFKTNGSDLRLVAHHAPLGGWNGVLGLQAERQQFSADGSEAFAPYSRSNQAAAFVFEELPLPWGRISLGARAESVQVTSDGNPQLARFVPASRSFSPKSVAMGALWNSAPNWQITSNLSYTERAPKDYELFADGAHVATHAYEVGNPQFGLEQATNIDLGLAWKQGAHHFQLSAFANRFNNYVTQQATGVLRDAQGNFLLPESTGDADALPEYRYAQIGARLTGLEASGRLRLVDAAQTLDLELRGDWVRGVETASGHALPRLAPVRLGASLIWAQGPWSARLDAKHAAAATDGPPGQLPTAASTLVNTSVSLRQQTGSATTLWFARLDNALDTLAYSASSLLTQTAPGKAPLPGRSLTLGVQWAF